MSKLFERIAGLGISCNISIAVTKDASKEPKDTELTVLVSPIGTKTSIQPLSVKGTAEELDNEFTNAVGEAFTKVDGFIAKIDEFEKAAEEKAKQKEKESQKSSSSNSSGKSKKAPDVVTPKDVKLPKKEEVKQEPTSQLSVFDEQ